MAEDSTRDGRRALADIDITKPNIARVYDYFVGGKDNFAVDRETAKKALKSWPTGPIAARENRGFSPGR